MIADNFYLSTVRSQLRGLIINESNTLTSDRLLIGWPIKQPWKVGRHGMAPPGRLQLWLSTINLAFDAHCGSRFVARAMPSDQPLSVLAACLTSFAGGSRRADIIAGPRRIIHSGCPLFNSTTTSILSRWSSKEVTFVLDLCITRSFSWKD